MKEILIVNDAELPYQFIGTVIDNYLNDYEEDTFIVGMVINYQEKLYSLTIRYLKKYIEFRFENYMEADNDKKRNISKD